MFELAAKKKVLFVGERITDVYHYGQLLGRPLKEPIVCIQHKDTQVFDGGVTAAAEHARSFVESVQIAATCEVRKERFLEEAHSRKLFEMYTGHASIQYEWPDLKQFDAVIVTDYGHGMMTPELVERLCDEARFLAVNVQTNAGNYGFNLATKYPSVDYLCVDEVEARLATLNQNGPIEDSIQELGKNALTVVVTMGRRGAIGYDGMMWKGSAFTKRIVDTMGAGDAFFAITACIAQEAKIQELLDIGNAAGALKAQNVGQKAITKDELISFLNRGSH